MTLDGAATLGGSNFFDLDEVQTVADAFLHKDASTKPLWNQLRHRALKLPEWFDRTLPPASSLYREQQLKLWQTITGEQDQYDPHRHEVASPPPLIDPVLFPGWYSARRPGALSSVGHHLIALGQLMLKSGLNAGDRVLEYGAGYGQIALTLGRMGVKVDTVDINRGFLQSIAGQAALFKVDVTPHFGEFGFNPREDGCYDAILFYESFHHAFEFFDLVRRLRATLKADGRVLLAGEPIVETSVAALPYAWGLRLDAETVAVMRLRGWFELGFQEDFLVNLFISEGFVYEKHPCDVSIYGVVHEFRLRPATLDLGTYTMSASDDRTWHNREPHGRWTRHRSAMTVDATASSKSLLIVAANYHRQSMAVRVVYGSTTLACVFAPGEEKTIEVSASDRADRLEFLCEAVSPVTYGGSDARVLGIHVKTITYVAHGGPGSADVARREPPSVVAADPKQREGVPPG